jgi:4-hydroxy-tetrahydrodipicolinate reductase
MKLIITGACGRMGRAVAEAAERSGINVAAGVDINAASAPLTYKYPIYEKLTDFTGTADVLVDFSHHTALEGILDFARERRMPAVIATTGHTPQELALMREAGSVIPIFYSRNMSLGVNLLIELVKAAAASLGADYNIEIVEEHHKHKLDAPSGTALMLAEAASDGLRSAEGEGCKTEIVTERASRRAERGASEIGIHSVRGGNIVGEHEVIFAGQNEVIRLSHSASSREVFADGAIRAAAFIIGKPAGIYSMRDLVSMY